MKRSINHKSKQSRKPATLLEFPQWARVSEEEGQERTFATAEMAGVYALLNLAHMQMTAVDGTLQLMLEKMAENENVREIAKHWDEQKAQIQAFTDEVYEMVIEEAGE